MTIVSVKSDLKGVSVGFDGGKKVKGRKRHVLTDSQGTILCVVEMAANVDDHEGFRQLLNKWFIPGLTRLRKIWAEKGYTSAQLQQWVSNLKPSYKIDLEITDYEGQGF